MTPKEILALDGVLAEAKELVEVQGYRISEAAHAIRKKYNPLENKKKKTMAMALAKALKGEELIVNEEARSRNIYLVGKLSQRVLNSYNKWKETNYTLVDFDRYVKVSPKAYGVVLKNGKEISISGREIRKIRNTALLTFMNFGTRDIKEVKCPVSGLPLCYTLEAFEGRPPVDDTYTYDLHHMDVSKDGKSEIKGEFQPSRIVLELDLFEQENIEALTEFFGMIMLSPSGHKGIHSEYCNEVHKIDDYIMSKRPYAIRNERNYLRFYKEFGLEPLYSYSELSQVLGFSMPKKRKVKRLTPAQRARRDIVKNIFDHYNTEYYYDQPLRDVYTAIEDALVINGVDDEKYMKLKSFGTARAKKAKTLGWV